MAGHDDDDDCELADFWRAFVVDSAPISECRSRQCVHELIEEYTGAPRGASKSSTEKNTALEKLLVGHESTLAFAHREKQAWGAPNTSDAGLQEDEVHLRHVGQRLGLDQDRLVQLLVEAHHGGNDAVRVAR